MTDNIELPPQARYISSFRCTSEINDFGRACYEAGLRARQAPAPVEVSRLAWDRLKQIASDEYGDAAASVQHGADSMPDIPEWATLVAALASTPVGEVPAGWSEQVHEWDSLPVKVLRELSNKALGSYLNNLRQRAARHAAAKAELAHARKGCARLATELRATTQKVRGVEPVYRAGDSFYGTFGDDMYSGSQVRAFALLAASPAPVASKGAEAELPGMWEEADLSGGMTDCAAPSEPEAQKAVAWVDWRNLASAQVSRERGGPFDTHAWSECKTAIHDTPLYAAPFSPSNPPRLRREGESVADYRAAMGWSATPSPAASTAEHWCALEHGGVFCKVCESAGLNFDDSKPACEYVPPAPLQWDDEAPAASMEDAATLCEGLAEMMEQGAGEVRPGQRLRQAARGIRDLAAKNGWHPGEGRG